MGYAVAVRPQNSHGGQHHYVIVTELYQENPGTSVTYAGRSLAEQI